MKRTVWSIVVVLALISAGAVWAQSRGMPARPAATPAELVNTYNTLADTILAAKHTEWNLVRSILASTYGHAEGTFAAAAGKVKAGKGGSAEIEKLADLVSQLGNEGDAGVAAIRKRLLEGGHHHNAKGEEMGVYDEGFVIVTRKAKKVFLDAARELGKMSSSPDLAALEGQWKTVAQQYRDLFKDMKH
jgi:hypothetical protein